MNKYRVRLKAQINFIKDIDGMVLFITNNDNGTMKNLAKKYNTQLYYVLADHQFTVK